MKRVIFGLLLCLFSAVLALGEEVATAVPSAKQGPQFSLGYIYQGSEPTFGGGSFGLNGGRADLLLPLARQFGLVAEFAGAHAGSVPFVRYRVDTVNLHGGTAAFDSSAYYP
jgi:hypothetical protein